MASRPFIFVTIKSSKLELTQLVEAGVTPHILWDHRLFWFYPDFSSSYELDSDDPLDWRCEWLAVTYR
jgi:hypothetical protein